jgi:outer membrane protein TolC
MRWNMKVVFNWTSEALVVVTALCTLLAPERALAEVVTLEQLEEQALQNQARWEAVEATMTQAEAETRAARAGKMPTFWMNVMTVVAPGSDIERVLTTDGREVNVRASPTVGERTAFRPNIRYEGTIDMRAPLYDGQTRAHLKAAEAYRAAAMASADASRETVLAMVRAAYLDWLATHLDHGFAKRSATEAREERERTTQRVDDGERPPAELDTARYQELQAELVVSDASARLDAAKRLLESAVGSPLPAGAEPDTSLLALDSEDGGAERKWEIEALELRRDAARQEADMHRKTRVPVLSIIGQTGLAGVNERVFPMYRLGLNLAVPLWDGGRAISLAHAADARAIELDALARDAQLDREDEQQQASIDRRNAEAQLEIANSLVEVSETRVDQARTSYDLGAGDLEAVADARAALRDAQSRRVQIQVARADAILRLDDGPP